MVYQQGKTPKMLLYSNTRQASPLELARGEFRRVCVCGVGGGGGGKEWHASLFSNVLLKKDQSYFE